MYSALIFFLISSWNFNILSLIIMCFHLLHSFFVFLISIGIRIVFIMSSTNFQNNHQNRNSILFFVFVFHVNNLFQMFIQYSCG